MRAACRQYLMARSARWDRARSSPTSSSLPDEKPCLLTPPRHGDARSRSNGSLRSLGLRPVVAIRISWRSESEPAVGEHRDGGPGLLHQVKIKIDNQQVGLCIQ
jgi:hypothetical protein